jgi:hypothetical protein
MGSRQRLARIIVTVTLFAAMLTIFAAFLLGAGNHWWSIAVAAIFQVWFGFVFLKAKKFALRALAPRTPVERAN